VQETCSGVAAACPTDGFEANGTSCSDGAFCNGGEACQSGVCQAGGAPCGGGQSCDEGTDQCFAGGCPLTAATCRTAGKSKLLIKDNGDDSRDKLIWKWSNGTATSLALRRGRAAAQDGGRRM
jgi:hypothetical protein